MKHLKQMPQRKPACHLDSCRVNYARMDFIQMLRYIKHSNFCFYSEKIRPQTANLLYFSEWTTGKLICFAETFFLEGLYILIKPQARIHGGILKHLAISTVTTEPDYTNTSGRKSWQYLSLCFYIVRFIYLYLLLFFTINSEPHFPVTADRSVFKR